MSSFFSLVLSTQSPQVSLFSLTLYLSHTTVGDVTHGVAGAPTYLALTPCKISFSVSEGAYLSTRSTSWFFAFCWEFRLLVSPSSLWKSHIRFCWAFLRFPDVIAVLCSTLWCRSWLSSPSSNIMAVRHIGHLFAFCLIAAVFGLGSLCHFCILGP
jgi:hypothetical protein